MCNLKLLGQVEEAEASLENERVAFELDNQRLAETAMIAEKIALCQSIQVKIGEERRLHREVQLDLLHTQVFVLSVKKWRSSF